MVLKRVTYTSGPARPSLKLSEALEYVISVKRAENLRERTLKDYREYFERFVDWLAERYPDITRADQVGAKMIRGYVEYLRGERSLSPYTVNVRLRIIKAVYNALRKDDIIAKDPARSVRLLRTDEKPVDNLTEDELAALLNAPDCRLYSQFRDKVAMFVALDTGLRVRELFSLELDDLDLASHSITLPAKKSKSRKTRILPLSTDTVRLVLELIAENKEQFPRARHLFLSDNGNQYRADSWRKRLHFYRDRARIRKPLSPHLLRKHFLITYLRNGGDLFTAQRIMGHADLSTTRRYWDSTADEMKERHQRYSPIARLRRK
ncbi:tyrosine-type recombinase/integrase [Paludifilum halophilum]|nr:tyrosine-type recombinase/integrase [Paludifilum halophilum]